MKSIRLLVCASVALAAIHLPQQATAQVTATIPTICTPSGICTRATAVVNPDGTNIAPTRATSTTTNGTVAAANTFQSALAANASRKGCAIYNTSANAELIFLGAPGTATAATSIPLPAGGSFNCGSFQGLVLTDQVSITSTVVASTFVVVSQ